VIIPWLKRRSNGSSRRPVPCPCSTRQTKRA
jgi:hypothetical protein